MHIFHIFSVYPADDVDGVPTVQQYDFLVHANSLTEAAEHVKDSWVPVHIKNADGVWGSTRVHTPSLILSPMNQLHKTQSKANYEAWVANRDPKHYISIKEWL